MDYRAYYPWPIKLLSRIVDIFLMIGGFCIIALVFSNAALRGFAGFDLAWSLEITSFLLLWTTFLGCAAAVARGAHMRVTEVAEILMPAIGLKVLTQIINAIVAVLMLVLIIVGIQISHNTWEEMTTVLYWPVGLLYASMPAGIAVSLIFHIVNIMIDARQSDHLEKGEVVS